MFSNHEDDDFFNPASSSHLASLFGTAMIPKQDAEASLVYTAPKQPKLSGQETPKTSPKPAPQSTVVCSKFVDLFKLFDKSHTPQGKCGLAIIGNESVKTYEIIIYKSKQDIITRSKLKPDFLFTVQNNNFAYFCDDQKQQWSVHFENAKEIEDVIEKIKAYQGRVVYNNKTADSCDTSQSTVGATETRIDENVSACTARKDKDSDSTSDSSQTRASILSRMAKVGQSILPINIPSKSSGHSDSETDEQILSRKPVKKKQKFVMINGEYVPSDKLKHVNCNQTLNTQPGPFPEFVLLNGQIVPASALKQNLPAQFPNPYGQYMQSIPNQIMLGQPQVSPMSDSLHVFIAENRTHNCEMRMNIAQLASKLDQVLSKIGKGGQVSADEIPAVNEPEIKISENTEELEKSKEIISNLQEQQKKFQENVINDKEIINNLKQQSQEQGKVILEQEKKIQELEKQISILEEQIAQKHPLQENFEEAQQTIKNLRQTIEDQQVNLKELEKSFEENKQNQNSKIAIDELNKSITNLKSQLDDKNSKADLFARKLKQSMNSLYQQIMENFEDENIAFQSLHIKQILSQKLKTATFTIIQEFQNDFKSSESTPSTHSSQVAPPVPQFE